MLGGYKPDGTEKALRFGCAFLFVTPCVFFLLLRALRRSLDDSLLWPVLVVSVVIGAVVGIMAFGGGDGFWQNLLEAMSHGPLVRSVMAFVALLLLLGFGIGGFLRDGVGDAVEQPGLDPRRQQEENASRDLRARPAVPEAMRVRAIPHRTDQSERERAQPVGMDPDARASRSSEETPRAARPAQPLEAKPDVPKPVKRLAPVDISFEGCKYLGGSLSCRVLLENTGSFGASIALRDSSSLAYDEQGTEYRLQQATLGSQRWSEEQSGGIRLEPGTPVAAELQFDGVPESVRRGQLRLVLANVQFGPTPRWQSVVFEDVPFGKQ